MSFLPHGPKDLLSPHYCMGDRSIEGLGLRDEVGCHRFGLTSFSSAYARAGMTSLGIRVDSSVSGKRLRGLEFGA